MQYPSTLMKQKNAGINLLSFSLCILFLSLGFVSIAQDSPSISKSSITESGREFELTDITVDGQILNVLVDTATNCIYLTIQSVKNGKLKKEGRVVAVDLTYGKLIWQTESDKYYVDGEPEMGLSAKGDPFFVTNYGAWGLNRESGKVSWSIDSDDFVAHPNGKMILANEYGNIMTLWNTDDGAQIWKYEMNFGETGKVHFTSDSCMVVFEKGIHHVRLPSGKTWYRKIKNLDAFNPVSSGARAGIVGGSAVAFGLIGGIIAAAATSNMDAGVGNKTSNYLLEENAIYVVTKSLAKYDHRNTQLWTTEEFPDGRGVSSIISLSDKDLILVDYGYRYNADGLKVRWGDASCMFYNKKSGKLLRSITLPTRGDDFLKDFVLNSNTISFLSKRSIFTIGLNSLETLTKNEFGGVYADIGLSKFIDPNDYQEIESELIPVRKIKDSRIYVSNTGNKIVEFDESLNLTRVLRSDEFYQFSDQEGELTLIKNTKEVGLIDKDGERISLPLLSTNACFQQGYLIDFDDNKAIVLHL